MNDPSIVNPPRGRWLRARWAVAWAACCGSLGCSGEREPDHASAPHGVDALDAAGATVVTTGATGAVGPPGAGGAVTHGVTTSVAGAPATTGGPVTAAAGSGTASGSPGTTYGPTSSGTGGTAGTGDTSGASGTLAGDSSGSSGGSPTLSATVSTGDASSTMTGAGMTGVGGSSTSDEFQLSWVDEFDTIDTSRWEPMTHSWDGNLAQFSTTTATVVNGVLTLNLTDAPEGSAKPYLGVEYRSLDTLTYGKVEARVRFARGSAVVSALVLIYTPWPPDDWNELDIEFLGTGQMQFNHMINIPPADPVSGHLQYPRIVELGFDPAADFHEYSVEWVPGEARFLVDGVLRHTATEEMSRMVLPQNILLTIWASDAAGWAGPVDATTAPARAEYDWIRVYDYTGP